jgi:hypothetical protein
MTSLLATRRRAEEFARHIEERRNSHDPTVAPLLEIVGRLRPSEAAEPAPVFRSALREHLMAVAADLPAAARTEPIPQRTGVRVAPTRARVTGFATALAVAGALVAVAAVARGSLPGDALYPVKTRLEGAQVAVASNPESRGRQYLAQSERRLEEMSKLVEKTPVSQQDPEQLKLLGSTLRDFTRDSKQAGKLLTEASKSGKAEDKAAAVKQLHKFATESQGQLATIGPSLPPDLATDYDDAMGTLDELNQLVLQLCPSCLTDGLLGQSNLTDPDSQTSPQDDTTAAATEDGDQSTKQRLPSPGKTPGPSPSQTVGGSPLPTSTLELPELPPLPTLGPKPPESTVPTIPLDLSTLLTDTVPVDSLLPLLVPLNLGPADQQTSPGPTETPATPLPSTPTTAQPTTPSPTTTSDDDGGLLDGVIDGGLLGDLQLPLL